MSPRDLWACDRKLYCVCDSIGVKLDVSRMKFPDDFLQRMAVARGTRGMRMLRRHAIL
jgi:hypothetical protein